MVEPKQQDQQKSKEFSDRKQEKNFDQKSSIQNPSISDNSEEAAQDPQNLQFQQIKDKKNPEL